MERDLVNDVEKVYQLWKDYGAALREGDIKQWLSLWTKNGIQIPPWEPYRIGYDQLKFSLERHLELFRYQEYAASPEEVNILGDWAYTHGMYSALMKSAALGNRVHICGNFLTILVKQMDGSWKIAIKCFNANPIGG